MAHFSARRADDPEPLQPDMSSSSGAHPNLDDLASRLEATGIHSAELVLDLVLHDLAEEARQAVSATGAAIALEREGELVCRAAAGSTVPDLGVRIHNESGLSGTCVKQSSTQICSDTERDDRVDAEACRRLGVRSIVVIPLFSPDRVIGILEVFSSRPDAFTAADVKTLEPLAATAAQTVQAARKTPYPAEPANAEPSGDNAEPAGPLSVATIMEKVTPTDPAVRVLRWLVIGLAIPLLVLIGFDWGWRHVRSPLPATATSHGNELPEADSQTEKQQPVATATSAKSLPVVPKAKARDDVSGTGGLVIYQNGKVIYREFPRARDDRAIAAQSQTAASSESTENRTPNKTLKVAPQGAAVTSLLPGVTGGRLLRSLPPQYPAQALADKREGSVVLHGTVAQDGGLQDLKVVNGDPLLSQAALEAVQQWKYEPYRRNGAPIAMPIDITIDFNLPK